jgi:phosphoribosylanthranilate isomerase
MLIVKVKICGLTNYRDAAAAVDMGADLLGFNLAGGINPDNVAAAIELGVYGIDVCSGIEARPGKKDHRKMKKLFENIQRLRG